MRASLEWVFSSEASSDEGASAGGRAGRQFRAHLSGAVAALRMPQVECGGTGVTRRENRAAAVRKWCCRKALGVSATWALANHEDARGALTRAIEIAQQLGDTPRRLRLLVALHIFLMRGGEIRASLAVAEQFAAEAQAAADSSYIAVADCLLGGSHHFMGHHETARQHLDRGLSLRSPADVQLFGLDTRLRALVTLGRVLWMSGFPDRAIATAQQALSLAERSNRPLSICFSYLYTAPLFLWCGDHESAHRVLGKLMAHPNWHALPSLHCDDICVGGGVADSGRRDGARDRAGSLGHCELEGGSTGSFARGCGVDACQGPDCDGALRGSAVGHGSFSGGG